MLFKLAFRNILAKPARAVATVLAIAAAIAMIFAMLSFKPAVYEYMYSADAAVSGGYEIRISASSSSDRLTATAGLVDENGAPKIEGIEKVVPSLKLFATVGDDYVQVRGFGYGGEDAENNIQILQKINVYEGSTKGMLSDDAIISRAAAKHFGVGVGDMLSLELGNRRKTVYIKAIANDSGYFLADSPYLVLGFSRGLSELLIPGAELYNEIYVKAKEGCDVDDLIKRVKATEEYSSLLVSRAADEAIVREQSTSLTAPIVLAGAAVMLLSVCAVVILNLMSEREKLSLVAKLTVIGATKKQIALVFAVEGLLLAAAGALIGAGLAVGVFVGILKLTLSASAKFTVSAWRLLGAEAIGFVAAAASSFLPMIRAMRGTTRDNMLDIRKKSPMFAAAPILLLAISVVELILMFAVKGLTSVAIAALGIAELIALITTLATGLPLLTKLCGAALIKTKNPPVRIAGYRLKREKRPARSVAVLGVGMAISMLLFMSWSLTTSIFGSYVEDFENMAIVSNVQAGVDVGEFAAVDGVKSAVKLVWQQGTLSSPKLRRSVQVLGSEDVLDIAGFSFITDEETVRKALEGNGDYVVVDDAFCRLYGIEVGDSLNLTLEGNSVPVTVGGVLSHRLFNGAYVVAGTKTMEKLFGLKPDTVLVTVDGDINRIVDELSARYSSKNYYVIEALEAFKWEMQSVQSVFDLIGTLAFTVAAFILAVCVANALVGRAGEDKSRRSLLCAGMSKDMLLASELAENGILALLSYAVAFVFSLPMTAALIAALNLFGLSFEFMFEAWVVATVGAVMGIFYALVPLLFGFKKGYTLKN